jgi:hypothetical protein
MPGYPPRTRLGFLSVIIYKEKLKIICELAFA